MADNRDAVTVIGPEASFKGELSFSGTLKIMGQFEGRITAGGNVTIDTSGVCKAAIEASSITIDGTHEGNLTASQRLELNSHANVRGDIVAQSLSVEEGAVFVGQCTVGPEAVGNSREPRASSMVEPRTPRVAIKPKTTEWLGESEPVQAGGRSSWLTDSRASD